MCNPAVAQFGLSAAGQVGNYMSQRAAVRARNRARLLNFRQDNIAYYNDAILNDVKWKNQQLDAQIAYDNIYQQAADAWRQQDLAVEQAYNKHANYNVEALQELYRKEYAGTQTGVTATRLANEGLRKVGMALTKSQRELMMAKDKSILQKEIIRNDANRRRRAVFQKTWRSPVHGFTPRPPALEGMPSAAGMILGIASSAVGAFGGGGGSNIFAQPDYVTNSIPTLPNGMTDWSRATVIGP
tara:strand:+ start:173 stop:898 length:726 start_codon:yes stop_codon:yes gene_type:complete